MKFRSFAIRIFLFFTIVMFCWSCQNYKKITYFKNISDSNTVFKNGELIHTADYQPLTIRPDDNLQVIISTIDPSANDALNLTSSINSQSTGNITNNRHLSNNIDGYLVDKNGNIDIPVIGTIKVAGLTTSEVKNIVLQKASIIFKQPVVNVRLSNFKVTVLGEVTKPGTYVVDGERANVLDALGLAGDMTIYGKRENVMLLRMENGSKKMVARFDLNDTKMLSSPYFYLRQGDIIYVEPSKGKAAATDISATKTYAIMGSVLSVILVIVSRL